MRLGLQSLNPALSLPVTLNIPSETLAISR